MTNGSTGALEPSVRRLVIATGNAKKAAEMAEILADTGFELASLRDYPDVDADVPETGCTYAENATIKALAAARATGCIAIADDAGLEIDALGGQPGVYSKRFLGEETPFPEKMDRILSLLASVPEPERGCRFRASVVIATPDGATYHCVGVCEGTIGYTQRGSNGFGYDPVFVPVGSRRHMAELTPEEKHRISHRGMALSQAKHVLRNLLR